MWEMRGEPRHHLSSQGAVLGPRWTAPSKLAPQLGDFAKAEAWAEERDRIRDAILERGWSERARPTRSRSTPTSSTRPRC